MRRSGLLLGAALGLAAALAALAPLVARIVRSWPHRVAVSGHSMEPTLRDGDWLMVEPLSSGGPPPAPGELVVARDQLAPGRLIVKRVASTANDLRLALVGDHPAHAEDVRLTDRGDLVGRPWLRYWPPGRLGRL